MNTPIVDFVKQYQKEGTTRFHMPGHKGQSVLGIEALDITEIKGADVLSEAGGIIGESQDQAARLFQTGATFYGTEGSSQCVKAMLATALSMAQNVHLTDRKWILAGRNTHRAMIDGCALLDLDVTFLRGSAQNVNSICAGAVDATEVEAVLAQSEVLPIAVYITSPDYLGGMVDIEEVARVCKRHRVSLLVDNAHGAYLAFLKPSRHPIALGASMCCDSAHKTLPVLTGGAYLHLSQGAAQHGKSFVPKWMTLFGSTSPSYLTLQSLDICNRILEQSYVSDLERVVSKIQQIKEILREDGIPIVETELLKIVINCCNRGYDGDEIGEELRQYHMEPEYIDRQYVVLMLTPMNTERDYERLLEWGRHSRLSIADKGSRSYADVFLPPAQRGLTIRQAVLAPSEVIAVSQARGRILAEETLSCPPAIPIAISGEILDEARINLLQEYHVEKIAVVLEKYL